MDEHELLTERFEQHRSHLRAAAYRMLGSITEADDALQQAWLRVCDQDLTNVENTQAWLMTVVGRICLNMLRSRQSRQQETSTHVPDLVVSFEDAGPEHEALLAESVGLALLVVLDSLVPAERLAFVLHDVFAVPFAEVAAVLDRSEAAVQQLASRARRRVHAAPEPDLDLRRQREVVGAFFAASRNGDFEALVDLLDPEVEVRVDGGVWRKDASVVLHGRDRVARHTSKYSKLAPSVIPVLVNGAAGAVVAPAGRLFAVMAFTVTKGKITRIYALLDQERLGRMGLKFQSPRTQRATTHLPQPGTSAPIRSTKPSREPGEQCH